tara:strand:- start:1946 stop:2701 length:756 start_codon:yes stop_codon:yes gene_type:complete
MSQNRKIKESSGDARDDALDALFKDYQNEPVTITNLPSKGKFYSGYQGIELKPLTFLDEQKILSSKGANVDIVSKLLEKTVEGVDIEELLSMDKMFLLMKVRELSYGDKYDFNITCPNCTSEIQTSLNLSENLNMTQVPDDLSDPREIMLPRLKVKAEVRFPRSREEVLLSSPEEVYKNMYRFVVSVDDNPDPVFISKALKRMHIQDVKTIMAELNKGEYGVNPRFIFECPECSHTETMAIPMDVNFFSVS